MTIDKHTARQLAKTYRSFFDSDNEAAAYAGMSGKTVRNAMSTARTTRSTVAAIDEALTAITRHNEYRPDAAFTTQQKKELLDELLASFDTFKEASLFCGFSKDAVNKWSNRRNGMSSRSADKVYDAVQKLRRQKMTEQNEQTQDIEQRANKKPLPQSMKIPPPPKREQEAHEAYTKRVDWSRWVYNDGDVRGISLRAMVEDGLYSQMHGAVQALEAGDYEFSQVRVKMPGAGRNPTDYILPLEHAQLFAAEANTPAGREFRRLLILKANELHRLIDGETGAHYRLGAEQARRGNHKESGEAFARGAVDALKALQNEQRNQAEQIQLVAAATDAQIERLAETTRREQQEMRAELAALKSGLVAAATYESMDALDMRKMLNRLIRDLAKVIPFDNGNGPYSTSFTEVYRALAHELGMSRADQGNAAKRFEELAIESGAGTLAIDYVDHIGKLAIACEIARELLNRYRSEQAVH